MNEVIKSMAIVEGYDGVPDNDPIVSFKQGFCSLVPRACIETMLKNLSLMERMPVQAQTFLKQ